MTSDLQASPLTFSKAEYRTATKPRPPETKTPLLFLQVHSHSHTPPTDQQHRPQALGQYLEITHILDALGLTLARPLHWTRQRRKHHRRILALRSHQLVENEVLSAA